jgi:hypothetical protein
MKPHACISDYFNTLEPHPGGIPSCASHEIREALRRDGPGRWYASYVLGETRMATLGFVTFTALSR